MHCVYNSGRMEYMIVGNDISEYQGNVDWNVYKNNTNFVIIRATIGTSRVDNKFVRNRDFARSLNIPLGFYHYSYPQYNSPESEADYFCSQLSDIKVGEIMALDFEENWSGDHVAFCKKFLDRVSARLNGYKPLIYLNQSQMAKDWKPVIDGNYGLWIAAYTYDPKKNTFNKGQWPFAVMQQWSSQQIVPGIAGNVDGNVFFGDVATFKKYGYQIAVDPTIALKEELASVKKQLSDISGQLNAANSRLTKILQWYESFPG